MTRTQGTNAFFLDKVSFGDNTVKAGFWIPKLELDFPRADGKNNWHKTKTCLKLKATIGDCEEGSDIFYALREENEQVSDVIENGEKYDGKCLEIPEGKWHLTTQAVNRQNSNWKSNLVEKDFSIDTEKPKFKNDFSENDKNFHGKVTLGFEMADNFLERYHLTIKDKQKETVFEKEIDSKEKEADYAHHWDTTKNKNGDYEITFETFDEAGNQSDQNWKIRVENEAKKPTAVEEKAEPTEEPMKIFTPSDLLQLAPTEPTEKLNPITQQSDPPLEIFSATENPLENILQ